MNGLTCLQDAFYPAGNIVYVHNSFAGPSLLETYMKVRQPVSVRIITCAETKEYETVFPFGMR